MFELHHMWGKNQKRTKSIKNNLEIVKTVVSKKNFYPSLEAIICKLIQITTIKGFNIVLVPLVCDQHLQ